MVSRGRARKAPSCLVLNSLFFSPLKKGAIEHFSQDVRDLPTQRPPEGGVESSSTKPPPSSPVTPTCEKRPRAS